MLLRALLVFAALPALFGAQTRIFPGFRIIANVYYVGDNDLASYLIVTPKGDFLINTGFEYSVPEIRARMRSLGFRFSDIKILLVTHAHSDHAAGMATMKRLTGAKMLAMEQEAPLLESGGKTDYLFGSAGWFNPVKVDRTFKDGEKIELGGTELTAHLTPGHTKGSTSYSFDVSENGKTYHVLIANMGNVNIGTQFFHNDLYPNIKEDYLHTFEVLKQLPCDVFLSSHAGAFQMLRKYRPGAPYNPEAFVDPEGYRIAVERSEARFLRELELQQQDENAWQDHKHFKDLQVPGTDDH